MADIDVQGLHLGRRIALMSDGTLREITNMFDENGDDTDEPREARACVVKNHETSWFSCDLSGFETVILQ